MWWNKREFIILGDLRNIIFMRVFITFSHKLEGKSNRTVLEAFKQNFEKSNCDHVEIIDDRMLVVKNDFIRFASKHNIWSNIRYAEVVIQDSIKLGAKEVLYKIDILKFVILAISVILAMQLVNLLNNVEEGLLGGSFLIFVFFLIALIIMYFRHRFLFIKTMKSVMI